MSAVRIIPCLDVANGRVVKGVNFVDLRDAGDPVEAAKAYDAAGADEICFLDITATHEDRGTLLLAGADKVAINSAAVRDPDVVTALAEHFGSQCVVVAIDARQSSPPSSSGRWEIFTHGGRKATGIDALEFALMVVEKGAGEILLTSMDRDGTKSGFDLALTRTIADSVPVPVIASGGVGNVAHLVEGVREGHASAVLAASIFHFGEVTIGEARAAMRAAGIRVRNR